MYSLSFHQHLRHFRYGGQKGIQIPPKSSDTDYKAAYGQCARHSATNAGVLAAKEQGQESPIRKRKAADRLGISSHSSGMTNIRNSSVSY